MTMFRYFPGNEGWSYHFAARIVNVAQLGGADFHEAHRILERVKVGDGESWYREWQAAAERVENNAIAAQKTYADLPEPKHLRIWNEAEGGGIHLMNDNRAEAVPYMLDWLLEEVNRLRGRTVFPI